MLDYLYFFIGDDMCFFPMLSVFVILRGAGDSIYGAGLLIGCLTSKDGSLLTVILVCEGGGVLLKD